MSIEPVDVPKESLHEAMVRLLEFDGVEPTEALAWMIHAYRYTQLVGILASSGIARALAESPRSTADLATRTEIDADPLRRLLGGLAWCGLVTRDGPSWQLTRLGRAILPDRGGLADDALNAVQLLAPAWGQLELALDGDTVPFDRVFGRPFFDEVGQRPDASLRLDRIMSRVGRKTGTSIARLVDLENVESIVDIGGGRGETLAVLLETMPRARGIVYDLERSSEAASKHLESRGLAERATFVAGSFFERVPAGADLYLLQRVLHDWDDERAIEILRQACAAMPPASRLLVVEELLPDEPPTAADHAIAIDLAMMVVTGGRERTLAAYERLANAAGLALHLVTDTGVGATVLELRR